MSYLDIAGARFYNSTEEKGRIFGVEELLEYFRESVPGTDDSVVMATRYYLRDLVASDAEIGEKSALLFGKDKPTFVRDSCDSFVEFAKQRGIRGVEDRELLEELSGKPEAEVKSSKKKKKVGKKKDGGLSYWWQVEIESFSVAGPVPDKGRESRLDSVTILGKALPKILMDGKLDPVLLRKFLQKKPEHGDLVRRFVFYVVSKNYNRWRPQLRSLLLDEIRP
ncbi:hypothetical protein FUAX_16840 [Fulvitalea axinellae]|uniref:Uncharacterized protein n=1 Tax=Fulvitalea axinellae TaxID=1182444 RepID=A0AAU9CMV6_9BACT|nr:hypothetical protein FUAX_16840 [Fulvitalea axinellae]